MCIRAFVYVYTCVRVCVCVCIRAFEYMCIRAFVCVCVCVCLKLTIRQDCILKTFAEACKEHIPGKTVGNGMSCIHFQDNDQHPVIVLCSNTQREAN